MTAAAADGVTPIDVSILVVSYNTARLTLRCLDTVVAETKVARYEIIVVDNASSDGSAAAIATHAAKPRLVTSKTNLGFAEGNNVAARMARGEYLLLLNPDTEIIDGAIDKLVAFARRRPQARIWGGRTLFADGRLNPASSWGRMTVWNQACRMLGLTGLFPRSEIFNGEAYGGWQRDSERAVDIVSGCFLLIRRADWEALGGLDATYFMYGEEADMCQRAERALGAQPRVTPEANIIHLGGASEPARAAKMIRLLTAKATLIRRLWHPALVPLGLALLAGWPLSRRIAFVLAGRLTGRKRLLDTATEWREIDRARRAWLAGYARATSAPGANGPHPTAIPEARA